MRSAALAALALFVIAVPANAQEVGAAGECAEMYRNLADPGTGMVDSEDASEVLGDDAVQSAGDLSRSEFMAACLTARGGSEGMGSDAQPESR